MAAKSARKLSSCLSVIAFTSSVTLLPFVVSRPSSYIFQKCITAGKKDCHGLQLIVLVFLCCNVKKKLPCHFPFEIAIDIISKGISRTSAVI